MATSVNLSEKYAYFIIPGDFKKRFYLFIHERHTQRKAETQAEGEAGSMQGARRGTDPGTPGSRPGLKVALSRWATGAALQESS